eukprot:14558-Heterococcus_DN1.PRE.2
MLRAISSFSAVWCLEGLWCWSRGVSRHAMILVLSSERKYLCLACNKLHNINMLSAANCKLAAAKLALAAAIESSTSALQLEVLIAALAELEQVPQICKCVVNDDNWNAACGAACAIDHVGRPPKDVACRSLGQRATAHTHSSSQQPAGADHHSRNSGPDSTATFTKISSAAAAA